MKSWNHSLWLFSALVVVFGIIVFFSLYSYSPSFFVSSSEAGSSLWTNNSGVATYEGDININGTNVHTEQTTSGLEIKNDDGNYTSIKASDFITASRVPDTNYSLYQNNINNLPNWRNPHTGELNYEEHYAYVEKELSDGNVEKGLSVETRIETLEAMVYYQQQLLSNIRHSCLKNNNNDFFSVGGE